MRLKQENKVPDKEITDILKEISERKDKLRNSILLLINNFEKETTIKIKGITFYNSANVRDVHVTLDFGI